jgi:hypothetical protein
MPAQPNAALGSAQIEHEVIRPDADYFHTKAKQCHRRARQTADRAAALMLRDRAVHFEEKARSLDK